MYITLSFIVNVFKKCKKTRQGNSLSGFNGKGLFRYEWRVPEQTGPLPSQPHLWWGGRGRFLRYPR